MSSWHIESLLPAQEQPLAQIGMTMEVQGPRRDETQSHFHHHSDIGSQSFQPLYSWHPRHRDDGNMP